MDTLFFSLDKIMKIWTKKFNQLDYDALRKTLFYARLPMPNINWVYNWGVLHQEKDNLMMVILWLIKTNTAAVRGGLADEAFD